MFGHSYKAKWKRSLFWVVEQPFCARGNAETYARKRGGWVVEETGHIVADYRPGWRRALAWVGMKVRMGIRRVRWSIAACWHAMGWHMRKAMMRRRILRRLAASRKGAKTQR